jgi:hypothetical protein
MRNEPVAQSFKVIGGVPARADQGDPSAPSFSDGGKVQGKLGQLPRCHEVEVHRPLWSVSGESCLRDDCVMLRVK